MHNKSSVPLFFLLLGYQLILHPFVTRAQSKIFKLTLSGEYAKAQDMLSKELAKKPSHPSIHYDAAWFYIQEDNPAFRPDSAWYHITLCASLFEKIKDEKQLSKLAVQGIRPTTIALLRKIIEKHAYEIADSINTVDSWEYFIATYKGSSKHAEAVERRNALAFEQAKEHFSYESFKEFMEKYPNAAQLTEAKKLYESLLYKTLTRPGTWQAFLNFIEKHPESPYVEEAREQYERLLFEEIAAKKDPREYARFIRQYPDNRFVPQAEDSLYKLFIHNGDVDNLYHFIQLYPTNKNTKEAWLRLYYLVTADFTPELLAHFEMNFPSFPFTALLNKEKQLSRLHLIQKEFNGQIVFWDTITQKVAIRLNAEDALDFSGRYAAVLFDTLWGYIDREGTIVIAPQFSEANNFLNGFAVVAKGNCLEGECVYGMIDQTGKVILPLLYEEVYDMSKEGLTLVKHPQKGYGYVNRAGQIQIPFQYTDALSFSEQLAAVQIDTLWGYVDPKGQVVISPQFHKAGRFSGALAPAADQSGVWGYIDKSGKWIIPPTFHFAHPFEQDKAVVLIKEKTKKGTEIILEKVIDLTGKFIQLPSGTRTINAPKGKKK